jgi:hypothetical protein
MVLIEMAMKREVEGEPFKGWPRARVMPRKDSYIWMVGQPWPVPADEDKYVMRIEAFGPEFATIEKFLPLGRMGGNAAYPVMDWLPKDAPYISEMLRVFTAS